MSRRLIFRCARVLPCMAMVVVVGASRYAIAFAEAMATDPQLHNHWQFHERWLRLGHQWLRYERSPWPLPRLWRDGHTAHHVQFFFAGHFTYFRHRLIKYAALCDDSNGVRVDVPHARQHAKCL